MRFVNDPALDFSDVLILPKRSNLTSRSEVSLIRDYKFVNSGIRYTGVPLIAANMDTVATFPMAEYLQTHEISTALHKHYDTVEYVDFFCDNDFDNQGLTPIFYTMGISEKEMEKMAYINSQVPIRYLCVDNANGYTEKFSESIKRIRELYPDTVIMAGNVVSPEMGQQLILSGADIVKVGIGSGSACTTRKMTGVGLPQLSAVIETADAVHGMDGHVCSDGGHTVPGDVVKAFAGGADFVMLGGMLAGHTITGLPIIEENGEEFMEFYGMSSSAAMEKHSGGVATYRAAEGKRVLIPIKAEIDDTIRDILGGLRSACTYVGAPTLKQLSKCTTFRPVNNQLNTVYGND